VFLRRFLTPSTHTYSQVVDLLNRTSDRKQTLLFSATMPKSLADFAQAGLQSPQLVRLDTETRISPDLKLAFFTVR
jgi:ATP-dependent RNA helicase DDX54/DBP10